AGRSRRTAAPTLAALEPVLVFRLPTPGERSVGAFLAVLPDHTGRAAAETNRGHRWSKAVRRASLRISADPKRSLGGCCSVWSDHLLALDFPERLSLLSALRRYVASARRVLRHGSCHG